MQQKVEDLADKMVLTRQIKDSKQRMKAQRDQMKQRVIETADTFFIISLFTFLFVNLRQVDWANIGQLTRQRA